VPSVNVLRLVRPHLDTALALLLFVVIELELWLRADVNDRPVLVLAGALATLPLAYRCRFPLAMFGVVWTGIFLLSHLEPNFAGGSMSFVVAFVLSLYSLGAHATGRRARVGAALIPIGVLLFVTNDGDPFHPGDVVFGVLIVGGPWLAGLALRLKRQRELRLEREKEAAEAAVVEERARIARELHDVVAHAISVVVLQARGGRRVLDDDPEEARAAFDTIERTATQALAEMRRLLGLLRSDDEQLALAPQPSLVRLDALVSDVRGAGLPVELEVDGEPVELSPGVDLSAYRIVQEALTNALKHAGPAKARVRISYAERELQLEIADDGTGAGNGDGTGHGLTGIRERVTVYGGDFDAGPRREGGFSVRVRLPYVLER
jgi:signal transduction histidine kinase